MPLIKKLSGNSEVQSSLEKELKEFCEGAAFITIEEYMHYMGCGRDAAMRELKPLPFYQSPGVRKKKYRIVDLAWYLADKCYVKGGKECRDTINDYSP